MLLADSNIWLALAIANHVFHSTARDWFSRTKNTETVVFCRATQQSFLRLLSTSSVFAPYGLPPLSNNLAWATYERFLADNRIRFVQEPRRFESVWKRLSDNKKPSPKLWMDAYLAAFAIAGNFSLITTDKGFKQFRELDLVLLPSE
jgi:uncharacterized protein